MGQNECTGLRAIAAKGARPRERHKQMCFQAQPYQQNQHQWMSRWYQVQERNTKHPGILL